MWSDKQDEGLGAFQIVARDTAYGILLAIGAGLLLLWPEAQRWV